MKKSKAMMTLVGIQLDDPSEAATTVNNYITLSQILKKCFEYLNGQRLSNSK